MAGKIGNQYRLRNKIRGTVARKQLIDLLKLWKKQKLYIAKETQNEAKIHFKTLADIS